MELTLGSKHETKTNYRKLIQDLREQYPHDPLSTLIIETFANALDAGATNVDIYVDENHYQIKDNGKGMSAYEFKEYHNVASLTKVKGEGGIGFAGVGAKIYLDRAEHIITETKSRDFYGASKWGFVKNNPVPQWEIIPPTGNITNTGTIVKVKLNPEDSGKLTKNAIIEVLRDNYNAVLSGYYCVREVKVNGEKVEPWKPQEVVKKHDFTIKIGRHTVKGFFIKSKCSLPDEFQGISVVVCGKTVLKQEWFKQFALSSDTITGLIIADHLIEIVTTSKTQLVRTSMLWKKFHAKISIEFSKWLEEIGAKPALPEVSSDISRIVKELERSINNLLTNTPELLNLANSIFQNIMKRSTVIKSDVGGVMGEEAEGLQKISGTLTGPSQGAGVETIGPEEGTGIIESDLGDIKAERVRRRMKSGVKIGFFEKPDDQNEGWIDPASQTITINAGHPAYKIACGLSIEGQVFSVWVYHVLRVVIKVLSKEAEENSEVVENKILLQWFNHSIDEQTKQQIGVFFPISGGETNT